MRGQTVPLILIPRFSGLVGEQDFATAPIDTTPYWMAAVSFWRGPLVADASTSPTYKLFFETSHDANTWFKFPPTTEGQAGYDPAPSTTGSGSIQMDIHFPRRWFRVRIELRGTNVGVTTWCTGNLEFRVE